MSWQLQSLAGTLTKIPVPQTAMAMVSYTTSSGLVWVRLLSALALATQCMVHCYVNLMWPPSRFGNPTGKLHAFHWPLVCLPTAWLI